MYAFYISYVIIWSRILFVGYSMKKKKAKFLLISQNKEIKEDIIIEERENIYYFSLKDSSNHRLSKEDCNLMRETKEILLELDFKKCEKSKIYLKKEKLQYNLDLKVEKCRITSTEVEIRYELNNEKYIFEIVLEGD